ncbi:hypothetical protein [Thiocystis violascens]|uniref:Transglycosylase family protein n=1 Tax=Thiocystis violascens (strain ATCC 17096 / DSM 198 / 6111) TaxID=765911 RepID=I3YGU8_THIV6|nr:hypothetical protein [Thiocystis violascens]AFL76216.1 hypothetical protein Thivi_4413 [Thiocystis violascens DSM 198]
MTDHSSTDPSADFQDALAWGAHVSPAFRQRVARLCRNLGWPPPFASLLMTCMKFESGNFSPRAKNPASSATGLIQFMASTAVMLGTSTAALARMSALEQLDYVEKYFRPLAPRVRTLEDMYLAILWPKGIGKPLAWVLWATGTRAYAANRALDRNRDGRVTKAEATEHLLPLLRKGLRPENAWIPGKTPPGPRR